MQLIIPEGPFSAYLFDCDGTIAHSLPLHFTAWNSALKPWGGTFPEDLFYAWSGIPVPTTVEMLNKHFGLDMPVDEVTALREKTYLAMMDQLTALPAVEAQIKAQAGKLPMAVVSGGSRVIVHRTLEILHLKSYFQAIICAEDCTRGKPHPEPFLTAASRLGVPAKSCLAFDDAEAGIQSALAAGMKVVRVPLV